ncbi:hypothetical protein ACJRO7_035178 [Eucalyptus globulus]|uniref:Uncharacterized protein n=1 Tax=Eucalyptus globulus TaxID=34317 RepID=A0ABD3J5S6_EUCGL
MSGLRAATANARHLPNDSPTRYIGAQLEPAVDPTLALKKKAADVAAEFKGTSKIFLQSENWTWMKSSIKTQLAKLLAEALRYYFFDSDALVEEAAGGEASTKIFRETDEQGFREPEMIYYAVVLKKLSSMGRLVLCAGDGARFLRHGISIWIDALAQLAGLYEDTRVGYATADANVSSNCPFSFAEVASQYGHDDFSAVTVEDLAMEVLKEIEKLTRVKKMMEEAGRPF